MVSWCLIMLNNVCGQWHRHMVEVSSGELLFAYLTACAQHATAFPTSALLSSCYRISPRTPVTNRRIVKWCNATRRYANIEPFYLRSITYSLCHATMHIEE